MIEAFRRAFSQWMLPIEYAVTRDLLNTFALLLLLFLSWYGLTEYSLPQVVGPWSDVLEYAFPIAPLLSVLVAAGRVRWLLYKRRQQKDRLPLIKRVALADYAAMCALVADAEQGVLSGFFYWLASSATKGKPSASVALKDLSRPSSGRQVGWFGLVALPVVTVCLMSPVQFYLGDWIATSLDRARRPAVWVNGGEACSFQFEGACVPMAVDTSPGGSVGLRGGATEFGCLRFFLNNWPRSGRSLRFHTDPLRFLDPRGVDVSVPARGKVREIDYVFAGANTWAVWADIYYVSFFGDTLQVATYSGSRITALRQSNAYPPIHPGCRR